MNDKKAMKANKAVMNGRKSSKSFDMKSKFANKKISSASADAVLITNGGGIANGGGGDDDGSDLLVPAGLIAARDAHGPAVDPRYTAVGESLRQNVPHEMQCSMFCGGRKCKYEGADNWRKEDMTVKGIFSHWVTDDLLAMSRPNSVNISTTISEFRRLGIKSIVNVQVPGEHASCGPRLEPSGFTYDPKAFMDAGVFFYNFGWKDYHEASMANILDMVKVLSFALSEGKVAVHCHAGLGRTGVLMACYLVYYLRVRSNDALRYVRLKRPNAVQTRKQIDCVKEFEAFFLPQCVIFSNRTSSDKKCAPFTIDQHLKRQKMVLHGFEARTLKHIPKIVYRLCERILEVCHCPSPSGSSDGDAMSYDVSAGNFTKQFVAFRFDDRGNRLVTLDSAKNGGMHGHHGAAAASAASRINGSSATSAISSPSDSLTVTRRSSRSMLLGEEDSGTNTLSSTPSGTRPGSETNSYIQSCSSALSGGVKSIDGYLDDGIKDQSLSANPVTREMASHLDMQDHKGKEVLPKKNATAAYEAILEPHGQIVEKATGEMDKSKVRPDVKKVLGFRMEINYRLSAWDRLDAEPEPFVLANLLLTWMEHLKSPILDQDGITYVVIYCDNIEAALRRLPNHVCYILEYLVRFVARLQPLTREQSEHVMMRIMAALTHQKITIGSKEYPSGRRQSKFPTLRGGTADSTLKFMMKLFDKVSPSLSMVDQINRLRAMEASASAATLSPNSALSAGGFNSLDVSGASAKPAAGGGGPQLASARSESRPSRPTTTVTDLRKDVTRMEVAAEVNKPGSAASTTVSTVIAATGSASTVRASTVKPGSGSTISRSSPHHLSHNSDDSLFENELRTLNSTDEAAK